MRRRLLPQDVVGEKDLEGGLRLLLFDGMCSQSMVTLTQGAVLVGFAVLLGASNAALGLMAAIGPLSNVVQVPAIFWIEKHGHRKRTVVLSCLVSRGLLVPTAVLPWLVPLPYRVPIVVVLLLLQFALAAVSVCGFNSWMHDLIPPNVLNRFFARRMTWSMGLGALLSLAIGVGLDLWAGRGGDGAPAYIALFVLGAAIGYVGCGVLSGIPEPRRAPKPLGTVRSVIAEPFRNAGFRPLLVFVGTWTFAANLAIPFFAVYLIRRLGMPMAWVLGLSVLSQIAHTLSLGAWGRFAERRGNRAVLLMAIPLFAASALLWPIAGSVTNGSIAALVLAAIHALAGASVAGVTLCAGNIALRQAPKGRGTAFLATNSLVAGLAATAAPLIAGSAADAITAGEVVFTLGGLVWKRLDVVFLCAAALSLLTYRAALRVREEGEIEESLDLPELWAEALRSVLQTSTVAGLRRLVGFPYARLRDLLLRRGKDATANRDDGTTRASRRP